ncbi:hypothetical protein ACKWTF_011300 [Chironomus riparius]
MLKFIFLILCVIAAVQSICLPLGGVNGLGYINICDSYKKNCKSVSSYRRTCINIIGNAYYWGNSKSSDYHCKVYSNQGCSGSTFIVGKTLTKFPWRALSYTCPWKC